MPNDKLEAIKRLNDYIQVSLGENAGQLGEKYKKFLDELAALNNLIAMQYEKNNDGEYEKPTFGAIGQIQSMYSSLIGQAQDLSRPFSDNKAEKRFAVVARQIHNLLSQDYDVISGINPNSVEPLPALINRARTHELKFDGELKTAEVDGKTVIPVMYVENEVERPVFLTKVNISDSKNYNALGGIGHVGTGIESRNFATSQFAKMMGNTKLIPDTRLAEFVINGEKALYTITSPSEGTEINKAPVEGDLFIQWARSAAKEVDNENFEFNISDGGKIEMLDMNVLNYLTGNRDGHGGNYKIKVDKDELDRIVITSITATESKDSFHMDYELKPDAAKDAVQLKELKYIGADTAYKLLQMSPMGVEVMLRNAKLSPVEVLEAQTRLRLLQMEIKASMENKQRDPEHYFENKDGLIKIIDLNEEKYIDINKMLDKNTGNNIFKQIKSLSEQYIKKEAVKAPEDNNIEFNKAELVRAPKRDDLDVTVDKLQGFIDQISANTPFLHINSGKFRTMKNQLVALKDTLENGETINEINHEGLFAQLKVACDEYIEAKGNLPSSTFGQNRLEIARQLRDFMQDRLDAFKDRDYLVTADVKERYNYFSNNVKNLASHVREYKRLERILNEAPGAPVARAGIIDEGNYISKIAPIVNNEFARIICLKAMATQKEKIRNFETEIHSPKMSSNIAQLKASPEYKDFTENFDIEKFYSEGIKKLDAAQLADKLFKDYTNHYVKFHEKLEANKNLDVEKNGLELGEDKDIKAGEMKLD